MFLTKLSFLNTVLVLSYENNIIRVCKINWSISWLIITNTDTAKMWPMKLIFDYTLKISASVLDQKHDGKSSDIFSCTPTMLGVVLSYITIFSVTVLLAIAVLSTVGTVNCSLQC